MPDSDDALSPPKRTNTGDPGAHELESSESDDHFSDAQSAPSESHRNSPIPRVRVEKVSDEPSYGEVPGTQAYGLREADAAPDEIAIIPEMKKSPDDEGVQSPMPGGKPIPKTVVEESEDTAGSQTHPEKQHRSDPPPDLVLKAVDKHGGEGSASDSPISPALRTPQTARSRRNMSLASPSSRSPDFEGDDDGDEADDFGDDFDDFEEGGEAEDFGEFDDDFQEPEPAAVPTLPPPVQPLPFPIPDFEGLEPDEILSIAEPYLNAIFPQDDDLALLPPLSKDHPVFLTPRSASLWSQLVAPPPLQPPDWIRSRIRRLFLVSLGVPVDLDEILPASKQKKLVLPSLAARDSPRSSMSRLRAGGANASSTSLDSGGAGGGGSAGGKARSASRRRKGPQAPDLDLVAAKQLCTTTDEALDGMTDAELQAHVAKLRAMEGTANELLEYWRKQTDVKIGDREAFEGVIENLVKHARKVRK